MVWDDKVISFWNAILNTAKFWFCSCVSQLFGKKKKKVKKTFKKSCCEMDIQEVEALELKVIG